MARTALTAPAHIVKQRSFIGSNTPGSAPDSAPSMAYGTANALQDHRLTWNKTNSGGNGAGAMCIGWLFGFDGYVTYDGTPPAASSTNIALAQNVPAGLALTLTAGTGVVSTSTALTALPSLNVIPAGSLAIGAQVQYAFIGLRDITAFYDPTTMLALAVSITGSASSAGQNFTVRGADVYGFPMSEVIAGPAGATTTNGKKAFKWIFSVTGTTAEAQNYSVGTTLIAGFHLAVDTAPYAAVSANNGTPAVPGTFVAALTSAAPTATNADVRGTCVVANNHTVMSVAPTAYRLTGTIASGSTFTVAPTPLTVGLFGQTQFTS